MAAVQLGEAQRIFPSLEGRFPDGGHQSLRVATADRSGHVDVRFKRTISVEEIDEEGRLPPDFGDFPLLNVDEISNLPNSIDNKGGLIIPVHEHEPIWISFEANAAFMVHVIFGGANAVSGERMTSEGQTSLLQLLDLEDSADKQDYVVVPKQRLMDGFATEEGTVHQFVARTRGFADVVNLQLPGANLGDFQLAFTPLRPRATLHNGNDLEIIVKPHTGRPMSVQCNRSDTIRELMSRIYDQHGIPERLQSLKFRGSRLAHNRSIQDYNIDHGCTVKLILISDDIPPIPEEPRKRIEKDNYIWSSWDTTKTLALNISLINARLLRNAIRCTGPEPEPIYTNYEEYYNLVEQRDASRSVGGNSDDDDDDDESVAAHRESTQDDAIARAAAGIGRCPFWDPPIRISRATRTAPSTNQ